MTPQELDAVCTIEIAEWIDVNSARCQEMDDNMAFTRKCMKYGFESGWLFTDSRGRIWGKKEDGRYYPFHFEANGKLYGYRLSAKAAN